MVKRLLLIGIATALALGILAATVLLGPTEETPRQDDTGPSANGAVDVAPGFDPSRAASDNLATPELFQEIRQGRYRYQDEGRTTLLFYDRLTPGPHGVLEVEQPIVQVYFSAARVLEIRAEACTFIAPDNQPRGGDFRGNVVVTLFETEDGSPVAFDNADHVQLRTYLDEANFDLDLGQLESEGPVELIGRQVTFRGRGLSLIYNEMRRRIERLEIVQGEFLRFQPRPQQAATAGPSAAIDTNDAADASPDSDAPLADAEPEPDPLTQDAPADAEERALFYRARFERDVRVDAEGGAVQIQAEVLDAVFTLRSDDWATSTSAPARPGPTRHATASAADAFPHPTDQPAPTAEPTPHDIATLAPGDRQATTIRWRGPMVLEPEHNPSDQLAGPDDVLLRLMGQPARLDTADDEQLLATEIEYVTSSGRIRAAGTEQRPIQLRSAEVGELHATALELDQLAGTGVVQGPGWLTSTGPDRLRVAWRDRLDLRFFTSPPQPDATAHDRSSASTPATLRPGNRVGGLENAHFHGEVHVDHADFQLDAGQLALQLTPPIDGRQGVQSIDARGGTHLLTRATTDELDADDQTEVRSGTLTVTFEVDSLGASHLASLAARDDVVAENAQWRLAAGDVEVELDDDAGTQPNTPSDELGRVAGRSAVRQLTAEGDVRFEMVEDGTELVGHRMVVNVPADQLHLYGEGETLARIIRPDATLAGPEVVLTQMDRSVRVVGPGWVDANIDPDDADAKLMVNWETAMHYDDLLGTAHLVGQVNSRSDTPTSRTRLSSDELHIQLATGATTVSDPEADADADAAGDALQSAADEAGWRQRRQVQSAVASDNALFTAESVDPATAEVLTRMRLEGPVIRFDGDSEQVHVVGEGRMLIVDNRPARDAAEADDAPDDADRSVMPGVGFTGRGATLFLWERQLTLDAARNDVLFEQGVQMVHRPADSEAPLQLDATRLLADLAETGGLANLTTGQSADPEVQRIRADGTVRVMHADRTIQSNHLQYTADDQIVRLWAHEGRMVEINQADQPTGWSAESFWWDLARDRFEARRPGPGIVPLPAQGNGE